MFSVVSKILSELKGPEKKCDPSLVLRTHLRPLVSVQVAGACLWGTEGHPWEFTGPQEEGRGLGGVHGEGGAASQGSLVALPA